MTTTTTTFWYAFLTFFISVCGWAISHDMDFKFQHINLCIVIIAAILLVVSASQLGGNKFEEISC